MTPSLWTTFYFRFSDAAAGALLPHIWKSANDFYNVYSTYSGFFLCKFCMDRNIDMGPESRFNASDSELCFY